MRKFFTKLSYKFQHFMVGRYGYDQLTKALLIFYLIGIILSNIAYRFSTVSYYVLLILSTAVIIFSMFRVFSKNIEMRRHENQNWLRFTGKIKQKHKFNKTKWQQRKEHKFVKCKKCKKVLRLPKNKGKINVNCPHCHNQFIVNTGKKKMS
ncbi:MAG: hypothetical protein LIO62_07000 [Clostridiales bacterium]|nr:hypothetical protein [Clostridiales bacterium]